MMYHGRLMVVLLERGSGSTNSVETNRCLLKRGAFLRTDQGIQYCFLLFASLDNENVEQNRWLYSGIFAHRFL